MTKAIVPSAAIPTFVVQLMLSSQAQCGAQSHLLREGNHILCSGGRASDRACAAARGPPGLPLHKVETLPTWVPTSATYQITIHFTGHSNNLNKS
eukprot:scaffold68586_cov20-Prasinocladus_malaysianus.AAC.1